MDLEKEQSDTLLTQIESLVAILDPKFEGLLAQTEQAPFLIHGVRELGSYLGVSLTLFPSVYVSVSLSLNILNLYIYTLYIFVYILCIYPLIGDDFGATGRSVAVLQDLARGAAQIRRDFPESTRTRKCIRTTRAGPSGYFGTRCDVRI